MRTIQAVHGEAGSGGDHPQASVSIWPKQILAPTTVRNPGRVLEDSVEELKVAGSVYTAEVSKGRRGENDSKGAPTTRQDLILIEPSGKKRTLAAVEYPESGYPATLMLGERDFVFLSIESEEELVEELASFIASLRLAA